MEEAGPSLWDYPTFWVTPASRGALADSCQRCRMLLIVICRLFCRGAYLRPFNDTYARWRDLRLELQLESRACMLLPFSGSCLELSSDRILRFRERRMYGVSATVQV